MPLREFLYTGSLYSKYIKQNALNIYGEKLVKVPVPKLVVFYNGTKDQEDERIIKLSDAFIGGTDDIKPDIEVTVRMLNINYGHNMALLNACRPLMEYAWYIDRVRENCKRMVLDEAVDEALKAMPDDFVIKPFLEAHRSEMVMDYFTNYDAEKVNQMFYRDGVEDGRAEGVLQSIKNAMVNLKLTADEAMDALGIASEDRERFSQML